jgi:hypothetical protein
MRRAAEGREVHHHAAELAGLRPRLARIKLPGLAEVEGESRYGDGVTIGEQAVDRAQERPLEFGLGEPERLEARMKNDDTRRLADQRTKGIQNGALAHH